MKKCMNPKCGSNVLFSDTERTCPFCHYRLTSITNKGTGSSGVSHATTQGAFFSGNMVTRQRQNNKSNHRKKRTAFLKKSFKSLKCHGRVTEIEHQELFYDRRHKIVNTLFYGEPYQLPHQVHEWTIRVEELTKGAATEVTDFCMFGNYLGRLHVGDSVLIKSSKGKNRRIVKKIFNETTGSKLNPGFQIPACLIRGPVFMILLMILLLVIGGIASPLSEGFFVFAVVICVIILPAVIIMIYVWKKITNYFDGRK